jgi:phenylalanyl-tRNA synthetase alpha chain
MRDVPADQKKDVGQKLNEVRECDHLGAGSDRAAALIGEKVMPRPSASRSIATLPGASFAEGRPAPADASCWTKRSESAAAHGFRPRRWDRRSRRSGIVSTRSTPPPITRRGTRADTFYFENGKLLRTHTSSVQIRTMEKEVPPVSASSRRAAPSAATRSTRPTSAPSTSSRGSTWINGVTLADLKGTLGVLLPGDLRGDDRGSASGRISSPSPSRAFEVDLKLHAAGRAAKWIEIAGCGMVDPAVFTEVSSKRGDAAYDPDTISGFAFGMGLDRLAMIMYGIPDLRLLIENDVRFLEQFRVSIVWR